MKKLMMFAAAMTIVGGAYAQVLDSGCEPGTTADCLTPVWDFKASGKTADGIDKGYKHVESFKMEGVLVGNVAIATDPNNGTTVSTTTWKATDLVPVTTNDTVVGQGLFIVGTVVTNPVATVPTQANYKAGFTNIVTTYSVSFMASNTTDNALNPYTQAYRTITRWVNLTSSTSTVFTPNELDYCCIDSFDVFLYDKSDKTWALFVDQTIDRLTVFGKGLDKTLKGGSSTSVESDIMWQLTGDHVDSAEIAIQLVGFGKGKREMSKGTAGSSDACNPTEASCPVESFTWPSWDGWFTGKWGADDGYSAYLKCDDKCFQIVGGTWSAKFNSKVEGGPQVETYIAKKYKVEVSFE